MAAELGVLAGQLRRVIGDGERHVDANVVAGIFADELLFKAGDERAAAEDERLLLRRAAVKLLAVRKAGVIKHQLVAVLRRTVKDRRAPLALLQQPRQLAVDLFFRDVYMFQSGAQTAILKFHSDFSLFYLYQRCRANRYRLTGLP